MKIFAIIAFGLAVIKAFNTMRQETDLGRLIGGITAFLAILIAYIWLLFNLYSF